jgi:galactose mutarotase-like enzyme
VPAVTLTSESLAVSVHPGHGAVIDSISLRGGPNLLWRRPGATLDDLSGDLGEPGEQSVATFDLDILAGGWFPMVPTVGPPGGSRHVWMHGEGARIPWAVVQSDSHRVVMRARTPRTQLDLVRQVSVTESTVRVQMSATNVTSGPREVSLGEHPCFPRELFAGGSIQITPAYATSGSIADPIAHHLPSFAAIAWPTALDVSGREFNLSVIPLHSDGRHDHVGLVLNRGAASLTSPVLGLRADLSWSPDALPFAMLWEHFLPSTSPWAGDVLAIEPSTTLWRLDSETRTRGHLVRMEAGATLRYSMALELVSLDLT